MGTQSWCSPTPGGSIQPAGRWVHYEDWRTKRITSSCNPIFHEYRFAILNSTLTSFSERSAWPGRSSLLYGGPGGDSFTWYVLVCETRQVLLQLTCFQDGWQASVLHWPSVCLTSFQADSDLTLWFILEAMPLTPYRLYGRRNPRLWYLLIHFTST